jgi:hypothetical protein
MLLAEPKVDLFMWSKSMVWESVLYGRTVFPEGLVESSEQDAIQKSNGE